MRSAEQNRDAANCSVRRIAEGICTTAGSTMERSSTLPADAYTDDKFFAFEKEYIMKKAWWPLAHAAEVPTPGDFINLDVFDEPLTIVRGRDGTVRVLSRVCRHRGMDMSVPEYRRSRCGHAATLLCPYHFWSYDLTGRLLAARHMEEAEGFDRHEVCLKSFRSEVWNGFVWFTFDPDIEPVDRTYGALGERLTSWNLPDMRVLSRVEWDCPFNWKILIENFMEPYHHMGAHVKIFEPLLPARHCWTEDMQNNFMVAHLPFSDAITTALKSGTGSPHTLPPVPNLQERDRYEWAVYCGFPMFLLITAPDKLYWYRALPNGPDRMPLETLLLVDRSVMERADIQELQQCEEAMLRQFHTEDMEACVGIQRGVRSSSYLPGRLSHLEKPVWLLQQYLANKLGEAVSSLT